MAQSGFTPILLYASGTPGNSPSAGNLTSSASGAELAVNYADGKLFYKDSGGNVQTLASKATGSIGGSDTQVQYNLSGALAGSANMTFNGTTLTVADLADSSLTSGRVTYATTGGNLTDSANLTFNGTTLTANSAAVSTGNLSFSGTAQRITGDFSNATLASRVMFQSSTANNNTFLGLIPNGSAGVSEVFVYSASDPANSSFGGFTANTSAAQVAIESSKTGTGTYLPMTFYTGGSERVRIDTSGNVGIGIASPGAKLNVLVNRAATTYAQSWDIYNGATFELTNVLGGDATNGAYFGPFQSVPLRFITNNLERMRIDSSGNVGIGTASPGERLNVNSTGAEYAIQWNSTGSNNWVLASATNRAYIVNKSTSAEVLTILNGGNVGIGTASPAQLVEASLSQNGKTQIKITNVNAGANTSAGVLFGTSSGDNGYIGANGGAASSALGGANAVQVTNLTANPLVLATNNTERMRITGTGNIVAGASAALATTATDGFLYVPTCAGTPTGTPTAITGMAPIVVDTTNNKLYFYSGGAWRDAGP